MVESSLAATEARLKKVAVLHETPPQPNAPDTLARFENMMRDALSADAGVARAYLHALVARVVVGFGRSVEAVAKESGRGQVPGAEGAARRVTHGGVAVALPRRSPTIPP